MYRTHPRILSLRSMNNRIAKSHLGINARIFSTIAGIGLLAAGAASAPLTIGCGAECYTANYWCISADTACGITETGLPKCVLDENDEPPRACKLLCDAEHDLMVAGQQGALIPGSSSEQTYQTIINTLYDEALEDCETLAQQLGISFIPNTEHIDCVEALADEEAFHIQNNWCSVQNWTFPGCTFLGDGCSSSSMMGGTDGCDPTSDGGTDVDPDDSGSGSGGVEFDPPLRSGA